MLRGAQLRYRARSECDPRSCRSRSRYGGWIKASNRGVSGVRWVGGVPKQSGEGDVSNSFGQGRIGSLFRAGDQGESDAGVCGHDDAGCFGGSGAKAADRPGPIDKPAEERVRLGDPGWSSVEPGAEEETVQSGVREGVSSVGVPPVSNPGNRVCCGCRTTLLVEVHRKRMVHGGNEESCFVAKMPIDRGLLNSSALANSASGDLPGGRFRQEVCGR